MKLRRILFGIAIATVILYVSLSASSSKKNNNVYTLEIGDILPMMNAKDGLCPKLLPKEGSHRYKLIHFWASYDADSRAKNIKYLNFFSSTASDKISYLGVSVDPDEQVFYTTLKIDSIESEKSIYLGNYREKVLKLYRLNRGLHTFLVDDHGYIKAVNPSEDELKKFYLI